MSEAQFRNNSALGVSLRRLAEDGRIGQTIAFENSTGLPEIYNRRIRRSPEVDIVVFVHDDVWIEDAFFADRVIEGLARYDVIGLVGNKRRVARQPGWRFIDDRWTPDEPQNLSGRVAHGPNPLGELAIFGLVPAECEVLDGLLLAARKSTLIEKDAFFDRRFTFHFYDMDFCRTARSKGLRLGTWPIAVTHQSRGNPDTPGWRTGYRDYLEKWAE